MNERFEGIVLFQRKYRDHDALVKIFTKEFGTKMFFIKRLNQPNHPLSACLVPLTHQHYVGDIRQTGLSFIKEGQAITYFRAIQTDIYLAAYAAYISQIVDAAVDDNVVNTGLYQHFLKLLAALNSQCHPAIVTLYAEVTLLPYFGITIDWQACQQCGKRQGPFAFSMAYHGLLCQAHRHLDPYLLPASANAIHVLGLLAQIQLDQIHSIKLSDSLIEEMRLVMDEIYVERVGIRLKSKTYLKQLLAVKFDRSSGV